MLVLKFGGTSVEDAAAIRRAAAIVGNRIAQQPVVVASALGGVTDQLAAMGAAACERRLDKALHELGSLRERHLNVAAELLSRRDMAVLKEHLEHEFQLLESVLAGIAALGELSPRTSDKLLGFGECLSTRIVSAAFRERGLRATWVDARECIVTDNSYTHAAPLASETNLRLRRHVLPLVAAGQVPVLAGYIAATLDGTPTTLGRGGSDFTAAIVGAALDADRIEIWTDVDGMMTADPRLCPDARSIEVISFDEAAELAHFGAKVLHLATVLPATEKNIPVYILNSRNPEGKGTRICKLDEAASPVVKAITVKREVVVVDVHASAGLNPALLRSVFEVLEEQRCPVDLVTVSRLKISFLVSSAAVVSDLASKLNEAARVSCQENKAMVCLVGKGVGREPLLVAKLFSALPAVDVSLVSHGLSDMNLRLVVDDRVASEVVRGLHRFFFTDDKHEGPRELAVGLAPEAGAHYPHGPVADPVVAATGVDYGH